MTSNWYLSLCMLNYIYSKDNISIYMQQLGSILVFKNEIEMINAKQPSISPGSLVVVDDYIYIVTEVTK